MNVGLLAQFCSPGITNGLTYALIGAGLAAISQGKPRRTPCKANSASLALSSSSLLLTWKRVAVLAGHSMRLSERCCSSERSSKSRSFAT